MTRQQIGTLCVILGSLCIAAAAILLGFNLREERRAAATTQRILPAVADRIGQSPAAVSGLTGEATVSLGKEEYLGILSLPVLGLELPVQARWDMESLRQSPCRYAGTLAGSDLVIAAHNYRRHFAALHTLQVGDAVFFTDAAGVNHRYTVSSIETLHATAVAEMLAGEWDLTLFTCSYDGAARVTVRCMRTEE